MKKKIHLNVALLSTAITILVAIFMLLTFYKFHTNKQMSSLKNNARLVSNIITSSDITEDNKLDLLEDYIDSGTRITLLKNDGEIIFDNKADASMMENHLDRPEVQAALRTGQGESIRFSTTTAYVTYYYTLKLENDLILRVSYQTENILSMFSEIMPIVLFIVVLIIILSNFTSSILANHLLKPINILTSNLREGFKQDKLDQLRVYDELSPFISTYQSQNKLILDRSRELEEKANLLDVITSSMDEGIILLDINKKIITINQSGIRLFNGSSSSPHTGEDFLRLCRDYDLIQVLESSIKEKSSKEIVINHNNNYLNIYVNPVITNDKLSGLLLLVVDSTEKHKLDLMRREFSANVSHELKTPLTSINGYAEMIKNGMVKGDDITKFAAIIQKEGGRLLSLIDDIIKLSKIEEGSDEKNLVPTDIYLVGKEAISSLESLAKDKNIEIEFSGESSFIMGNRGMLEDLIYNLVENSIKYTNPGDSVKLSIRNDNRNSVVKVKDSGIGISVEHQGRIFERFYIVDKARSKSSQSTGLGLSIVKHIVEYHKGTIELESELGKGTEITIKFDSI